VAEDSIVLQAFLELRSRHPAFGMGINELERVQKIKITLLNELSLGILKLALMLDDVLEYLN